MSQQQDLAAVMDNKTSEQKDNKAIIKKSDPWKILLNKYEAEIIRALPKHMELDRFCRIVVTAIKTNPKLMECSPNSIISSVMNAAQVGLEPMLGQCYLIPYYNKNTKRQECQFQMGYKGLLQLVRNSGEFNTIYATLAKENDPQFKIILGSDPKIEHTPMLNGERGKPICYYALAKFKDGGEQFEWMTLDEIKTHRDRFNRSESGPWITDFEAMAKKTVLKKLCNILPLSAEVKRRIDTDEKIKREIVEDMAMPQENEDDAFIIEANVSQETEENVAIPKQ